MIPEKRTDERGENSASYWGGDRSAFISGREYAAAKPLKPNLKREEKAPLSKYREVLMKIGRILLKTIFAGVIAGSLGVLFMAFYSIVTTSDVFSVQKIEVRGVTRTNPEGLSYVYRPFIGGNIFQNISKSSLLTSDPWVLKLEIKRAIPDKLLVTVIEDKELLSFKTGEACSALTVNGNLVPIACDGITVEMAESPLPEELALFAKWYAESDILKSSRITLKNGFFYLHTGKEEIISGYTPDLFNTNYERYIKDVRPRYKSVEYADLTVKGRIFVKGS